MKPAALSRRSPVLRERLEGRVSINGGAPVPGWLEFGLDAAARWRVSTTIVADPSWSHIDAAGHFHAWTADGMLPTLQAVPVNEACGQSICGDCTQHAVVVFTCVICGQAVTPRRIPATEPEPEPEPGSIFWTGAVVADRVFQGRVSVLTTDETGRAHFGVALASPDLVESDRHGVQVTTRLDGIGRLGIHDRTT